MTACLMWVKELDVGERVCVYVLLNVYRSYWPVLMK